jgi:hypothetical protein
LLHVVLQQDQTIEHTRSFSGFYCTVNDAETIDCKNVKGPFAREERATKRQAIKEKVGERRETLILHNGIARGCRLNSSHALKHCGVISLGALSGLHLIKKLVRS